MGAAVGRGERWAHSTIAWHGQVAAAVMRSMLCCGCHFLSHPNFALTLPSSGSGVLNATYSVPTHDSMPSAFGRRPSTGASLSSRSLSMACRWRVRDAGLGVS